MWNQVSVFIFNTEQERKQHVCVCALVCRHALLDLTRFNQIVCGASSSRQAVDKQAFDLSRVQQFSNYL